MKWIEGPWFYDIKDGQATMKIQVADGLMITAHGSQASFLMGCEENCPSWGGIMIWDVKTDPETPKYLGKFECPGGQGVHRSFYSGGRYAYITGCDDLQVSFCELLIYRIRPIRWRQATFMYRNRLKKTRMM